MRELKRKKRIYEEIKVGDEVLKINIDPTALVPEYNRARDALLVAQAAASKTGSEADLAQLGEVITEMVSLMLGTENAEKVLAFYEGDYVEMMEEVIPYLNEVLVPQFLKAADEKKKEYRKKFGRR